MELFNRSLFAVRGQRSHFPLTGYKPLWESILCRKWYGGYARRTENFADETSAAKDSTCPETATQEHDERPSSKVKIHWDRVSWLLLVLVLTIGLAVFVKSYKGKTNVAKQSKVKQAKKNKNKLKDKVNPSNILDGVPISDLASIATDPIGTPKISVKNPNGFKHSKCVCTSIYL